MAMEWGDAGTWAAVVFTACAVGVAVWAAVDARKARKAGEESAREANGPGSPAIVPVEKL